MTEEAVRIFPKPSELNKILNNLECPEQECTEVFQNTPNLHLHLLKTHGKERSLKSSSYGCRVAQYYCPEVGCKYSFNPAFDDDTNNSKKFSNRYFTQFRYLKQHYIKVHLDKKFICDKCNKGFPTDIHRSRHYEICGNKYPCSCGVVYSSLASLQTHARREQHLYNKEHSKGQNNRYNNSVIHYINIVADRLRKSVSSTLEMKNNNIINNEENVDLLKTYQNENINSSCNLLILPKGARILVLHGTVELEKNINQNKLDCSSISTQTDMIPKRRKTLSPVKNISEKLIKKQTSKQTQTGEKRPVTTTETQTVVNYVADDKRKASRNSISGNINGRKRKKSMETQTLNNVSFTNDNNNISNNNNNIIPEYQYSCKSSISITDIKNEDEYNSSDSSIAQKDISLPQLWLKTESENNNKNINNNNDKEVVDYLVELSSIIKDSETISTSSLDTERNTTVNHNQLLFYDQQEFTKETIKESINTSCHIETQTDNEIISLIDDYLTTCCDNAQNNNEDDILDQYTRWTQTCDDIVLPDDIVLDFTNNETQTAWSLNDDSFISGFVNSETQTQLPDIEDFNIN
ncbi:ASCIZ zinc finger protein [Lycorma delicatula]|uniref:ASCIZ zinc finger protein n=1 Tax=Lycorma delicatula TaxID=130591 RepID=UPI003F51393B